MTCQLSEWRDAMTVRIVELEATNAALNTHIVAATEMLNLGATFMKAEAVRMAALAAENTRLRQRLTDIGALLATRNECSCTKQIYAEDHDPICFTCFYAQAEKAQNLVTSFEDPAKDGT